MHTAPTNANILQQTPTNTNSRVSVGQQFVFVGHCRVLSEEFNMLLKFSDIGYKTPWNHSIIIFLSQISGHILLLCYSFYYISWWHCLPWPHVTAGSLLVRKKANRSDLSRNTLSCLKARLSISASSSNMSFRNGNAMVQEETQMNRTLYIALITDFIQPFLTI